MRVTCSQLLIEPIPTKRGPQRFQLAAPFEIQIFSTDGEHRHHLRVPAGFVTDFASIPRPLKWLFPDSINYGRAALVHDQLYADGHVGKVIADALLKGLIEDLKEGGPVVAELVFLGVHLFGFVAWRQHRQSSPGSDSTGRAERK